MCGTNFPLWNPVTSSGHATFIVTGPLKAFSSFRDSEKYLIAAWKQHSPYILLRSFFSFKVYKAACFLTLQICEICLVFFCRLAIVTTVDINDNNWERPDTTVERMRAIIGTCCQARSSLRTRGVQLKIEWIRENCKPRSLFGGEHEINNMKFVSQRELDFH